MTKIFMLLVGGLALFSFYAESEIPPFLVQNEIGNEENIVVERKVDTVASCENVDNVVFLTQKE